MQGVIFDFDGPFFDGRRASQEALDLTLSHYEARFGRPALAVAELSLLRPRALIALAYADVPLAAEERADIVTFYRAQLRSRERCMTVDEHILKLVRTLKARGVKVAALSSRKTEDLETLLADLNLEGLFDVVLGRESEGAVGPRPEDVLGIATAFQLAPEDLVLVGDSDRGYDATKGTRVSYYHAAWTGEPAARAYTGCRMLLLTIDDLVSVLGAAPRTTFGTHTDLPQNLRDAIVAGRLVFYAGAGVSVPSGIGDWNAHYLPVVRQLGVAPWTERFNLPELLQLVAADPVRAENVYRLFKQSFAALRPSANAYHYAMIRSRAAHVWTTNYDQLFESAVAVTGSAHRVIKSDQELLDNFEHDRLILKMNGDFEGASFRSDLDWGMVFLEHQFDLFERDRRELWRLFEDDYRSSSIVFVGASFKDPALRRLLSNAAKSIPRTRFRHHLLMKAADHPADRIIEAMHVENLKRVHIDTHLFPAYTGIQRWVQEVASTAHRPIIGFSGTAKQGTSAEPDAKLKLVPDGRLEGASLDTEAIVALCRSLGAALARRGFRVTSGHGPGVGIPSVEAAFDVNPTAARFYLRKRGSSQFARSAPAVVVAEGDYEAMRRRFILELDLLIVIGGDHRDSEKSGTEIEIDMALARSIPVLLLQQGGGAVLRAKPLVMQSLASAYPDRSLANLVEGANRRLDEVLPEHLLHHVPALVSEISNLVAASLSAALHRPDEEQAGRARREW